jgi:predicted DNA-binding protein with PD1-like motif
MIHVFRKLNYKKTGDHLMSNYDKVDLKKRIMGKLEYGCDLLEEISSICKKEHVFLGKVCAIGAVQKARLAYYDQTSRAYLEFEIAKKLEIACLIGNISIRNNEAVIHAHITLADNNGNTYAGHLMPGTIIFACEFIIDIYEGPAYIREYDSKTGLSLWKM